MRVSNESLPQKFANLLLEKRLGFSKFIVDLSSEIENEIREKSGESFTDDEDDSYHAGIGRIYHDFYLLDDFEPHESIEDLLSNDQLESMISFSNIGYIGVNVMRISNSHEWEFSLNVPKSPHQSDGESFELQITLEFFFRKEERIKITSSRHNIEDDEFSKIYLSYSLKYD